MRVPFDVGVAHYDPPPPDAIENLKALEALRKADRFRFANRLSAWIEVDKDGNIAGAGYDGGGQMGATTMRIGRVARTFEAIALPDIQREIKQSKASVTFEQDLRRAHRAPAPAACAAVPFIQWQARSWTTLSLTLHAGWPRATR